MPPAYPKDHHDRVRQEFTAQAPQWAQAWASEVSPLLRWLVEHADLRPDAEVLDVAAGTGLLARAVAPWARRVTALDLTPAMLERGRQEATRHGLSNIAFVEGLGESLPYPPASFDLVATRFSFHHAVQPQAILREMIRVCRPGGRVAVIDMLAPEDAAVAERYNGFERLRDPSHTWAMRPSQWRALIDDTGLIRQGEHADDFEQDLLGWLGTVPAGERDRASTIIAALEAELAGGPITGMRPLRRDDRLLFVHTYAVVLTQKPKESRHP